MRQICFDIRMVTGMAWAKNPMLPRLKDLHSEGDFLLFTIRLSRFWQKWQERLISQSEVQFKEKRQQKWVIISWYKFLYYYVLIDYLIYDWCVSHDFLKFENWFESMLQ